MCRSLHCLMLDALTTDRNVRDSDIEEEWFVTRGLFCCVDFEQGTSIAHCLYKRAEAWIAFSNTILSCSIVAALGERSSVKQMSQAATKLSDHVLPEPASKRWFSGR